MTAIFSIDIAAQPQYLDLLDISAGYGSLSVPVDDLLPGDVVDAMYLTIQGDGLTTISSVIDQVQRTAGFFEWSSSSSVSGHFTLTAAEIIAIAAATNCVYSVQMSVTRSETPWLREVQSGNIAARPAIPSPPLIVTSITILGGPVVGAPNDTTQLSAVGYDSYGNIVPGVTFAWSSQDESVATVDETGLVTNVGIGGTSIIASSYGVFATTLASTTVTPFTQGGLVYAFSTSALAFLPIGTAAQYLRVNAGATAPEWDTLTAADVGPGIFQSGDFTFGGNVLFSPDDTYDIGGAGVTRPRDLNLGRNLLVGGTTKLGGIVYTWPGSQAANKVLKTDGAGALSWSTPTEEIALTDLTDVTITSATSGDVLRYSGSAWVNSTDGSALTALVATQLTSGTVPNARLAGAYTGVTGLGTLAADLLFGDALYDIGKTGATRPRDLFLSRNATVGGTLGVTGTSTLGVLGAGATTVSTLHATGASTLDGDVTTMGVFVGSLQKTLTFSTHLTGSSFNNSSDVTLATDAVATNTASTIVARDASGNFAAGTITATLTGHSSLDLPLTGGTLTGNLLFTDATYDIGASGATRPRSGFFSTNITVGGSFIGALQKTLTFGTHLTGTSFNNTADVTLATDATNANTVSTIVARDGSGNFSAGTITASLTGLASLNLPLAGGTLTGDLLFTDALYDIGKSGATRPRHGYFSGNVTAGSTFIGALASTLTFGTHLAAGGSSFNNSADVTISTDAASANTVSTIVARDGSGNFSAGTITASITGHASLDLPLTGGTMTGNLLFTDATYDIGATGATRPRSAFFSSNVTVGGAFIGSLTNTLTFGTHLISGGSSYNNSSAVTISTDATSANTVSTIVARDGSGNFSAGTVTATLIGAAPAGSLSGATLASGVTASSLTSFGTLAADLLFTDATYDIGKTGATRPRDGFFSRNVTIGGTLHAVGATTLDSTVSFTGGTFTTSVASITALATPSAYVATAGTFFASTVSGATLMGFGTTGDATIKNRAGTDVLVVVANSTTLSIGGNLIATADATNDFGASGANRFRDGFLSRNLTVGGALTAVGGATIASPSAGTVAATFNGLFSASGTVDLSIWNRNASAAVAMRLRYDDAATNMRFGTSSSHDWILERNGSTVVTIGASVVTFAGSILTSGSTINFGGLTNSEARITRSGTTIQIETGAGGDWGDFHARSITASAALTIAGAITGATTIGSSGTHTFTGSAATALPYIAVVGTTTANQYQRLTNTGADLLIGIENSAGGSLLTGSAAYATVLNANIGGAFQIGIGSTIIGQFVSTGFKAGADASFDIGASGANRFRDLFLSRNATIGGTTSLADLLTISKSTTSTSIFRLNNTNGTFGAVMSFSEGGTDKFYIGKDILSGAANNFYDLYTATAAVRIFTNTTLALSISTAQAFQMPAYGAGAATFDASGNITSVSDERLKNIVGPYTEGLAELRQLNPILYSWNEISGMEMGHLYAGFSAQNAKAVSAFTTGQDARGYLSFQDRAVLAMLVNAVKALDDRTLSLVMQ